MDIRGTAATMVLVPSTHATDPVLVGGQVRSCRRMRGLSLRETALRTGLSVAFLSMVENGQRLLDRRAHVLGLAAALAVSPAELTGWPDWPPARVPIPALLGALRVFLVAGPTALPPRTAPAALARAVRTAAALADRCDYEAVIDLLPGLLNRLHSHLAAGPERTRTRRMLVRTYLAAALPVLLELGLTDLARLALERACPHIDALDAPLLLAQRGYWRARIELRSGQVAAGRRELAAVHDLAGGRRITGTQAHQLLGAAHLLTAFASAGAGDATGARACLATAARHATAMDRAVAGLPFGPTHLGTNQLEVLALLGRTDEVCVRGPAALATADPGPMCQAVTHNVLGVSLAAVRGREQEALRHLLLAESAAPQRIQHNAHTRSAVAALLSRPPGGRGAGRSLRGLAFRLAVPGTG
ncbi:helix-turn-helix domain-containing protein [Crossiella equi]|uniref:helix-turn-helix domain-containing protein n=1 Tax=Crossiella equi TaxID=130796 RepID=UPI0013028B56|nr:helix-turn-helix transcriptional regulator [Crossiella equi]